MLDNNKTSYLKIVLLLFIILLGVVIFFYMLDERKSINKALSYLNEDEEIIEFSHDGGIYNESISLELKLNKKLSKHAQIFYTLDGTKPNKKKLLYVDKIKLDKEENKIKVYGLSFIVYYKGGYSKSFTKTYIISDSLIKMPIINLIVSKQDLYDDVDGLFVLRNYNLRTKNAEKTGVLMMYDEKGNEILNQKIGLLLSGNTSVRNPVKSLKLIAGSEYDKNNIKFNYTIQSDNSIISQPTKYNSLRLNSGGQDYNFTYLKNDLVQKLAYESNFDGYKDSQKVLVFLNNEYYSIMSLEQSYSNSFIKDRYKLNSNDIMKIKGKENEIFDDLEISNLINDLSEENMEKLESIIDIDNYLLYCAIEILSNNSDWPNQNFEMWKYNGSYDSNNKYTDGKYRFLLYDLDFTYLDQIISKRWVKWAGKDKLKELMEEDSFFAKIVSRKKYKDKFVTIINNLSNTSFATDNILSNFDYLQESINDYLNLFMTEEEYNDFVKNCNDTTELIKNRTDEIDKDIKKYLDAKNSYAINFKTSKGSLISIENLNIYENSDITYSYNSNNVTVKASSYPGYNFKYFIVNGEKIENNQINVDSKSKIEIISEKNNDNLIISEIKSNNNDYIILTNISDKKINLNNYYLSDRENKLEKYNLPSKKLNPNQSIKIYCKNNMDSKIGDYVTSFNLKSNEFLYVYNYKDKRVEDKIYIPDLNKREIYYRDNNSNIFKIKLQN